MDIPVFCYHNAVADSLEKDLAFLAANGYRTLYASEVVDILTGAAEPPARPVALTFDDGLASVMTVGLPLLERYDARATVFVITGLVPEGRTGDRGEGARTSEAGPPAPARTEPGRTSRPPAPTQTLLLGWDDLRELRAAGRFEIGAHGHRHNPVHVRAEDGPPLRVADYPRIYDVPVPYGAALDESAIRALDGRPQRPSAPLFAADAVLIDGVAEPARELIAADLRAAREQLAGRIGAERFHLCLPYGAGSESLPALARAAGFESICWSHRAERDANRPGDDPYRIVRRKHDFVRRLPGEGRRSSLDVLLAKLKRRLAADPWQ